MGDAKLAKSRCPESGGEKGDEEDQHCDGGCIKNNLEREGEEWRKKQQMLSPLGLQPAKKWRIPFSLRKCRPVGRLIPSVLCDSMNKAASYCSSVPHPPNFQRFVLWSRKRMSIDGVVCF